jgi:lipopolysaccharide transport system ATP-binding protein
LWAVRVRTEEGQIEDTIDIRKPVGIEMEFEVLQSGYVLVPNLHFFNEQRVHIFVTADTDPSARVPRPAGHYISTVWIPGNFLSEGILLVNAALSTPDPVVVYFHALEVVAFQVIDSHEGDSVRGDYKGPMPGVVRPKFPWTTEFSSRPQTELCLAGQGSAA